MEELSRDAKMVSFQTIIFNPKDHFPTAPDAVVDAFGGDQRVADCSSKVGPAGEVFPIIEVVVKATIDMSFVVVGIEGIQVILLFVGSRTAVIGAGLFHCVVVFIHDVGDPAVFVVESEPGSVNAVGPVLNAEHAGAVVIGDVALDGRFPAVATPVDTEKEAATLVANHVILVAERTFRRGASASDDAEIILERDGHHPVLGMRATPNRHVIESKMNIEARKYL